MMSWLRLHQEARTDKKLCSLTDAQFRVWFNLLCFSGEQPERGRIGFDDMDLLAVEVANGDADLLRETITRLGKLKMLDVESDAVAFTNFEKRQYDKPSDTPEETRRRKERQRDAAKHGVPVGNVTPSSRDVTRSHETDTDTDTDTDTETGTTERPPTVEAPQASPTPTSSTEPTPPKPAKPPSPAKLAADRLYDRRLPIFLAFCRGLGIEPDGMAANQRKGPSLQTLTPALLDTPECVPEVVEPLTRYATAAFQWRAGRTTPSLAEVVSAFPEWDGAGRPAAPAPKANGRHPPPGPARISHDEENAARVAAGFPPLGRSETA